MAESFFEKPKVMPTRAQRIRYSIQLEVEAGMEERLEALNSKIQRVKSALRIATDMCVDSRGYMTSGWRNLF